MPETAEPRPVVERPASDGPLLSGNVPQPISYSGQNYIELRMPADAFIASARGGAEGAEQ